MIVVDNITTLDIGTHTKPSFSCLRFSYSLMSTEQEQNFTPKGLKLDDSYTTIAEASKIAPSKTSAFQA